MRGSTVRKNGALQGQVARQGSIRHGRVRRLAVPRGAAPARSHAWGKDMVWFLLMLIGAIAICSWLSPPGSSLNRAAWQALDSTVATLSQGDEEDEGVDGDEARMPSRRVAAHASGSRGSSSRLFSGVDQSRVSPRRKRITPFQAKRVAARQKWRCAMCNELLTEDFECDHIVPLHRGGSLDNDIDSLQALHKRCHLLKNSLEQRRS